MRRFFQNISLIMCLALCAGCGGTHSDPDSSVQAGVTAPAPLYDEHMDISIAYWQVDEDLGDREHDAVLQYIEQKFNITLEPVNMTWDDYTTKLELWMDTGALPDVFAGDLRTGRKLRTMVNQGLLKEIPSDLSAWPYLAQYMDSTERESCMLDGKCWCIFRQTYTEQAETVKDRTILYRKDLAEKAGFVGEPRTWDEFRSMLLMIMKEDPEGRGIGGMTAKNGNLLLGQLVTYSVPLASTGGTAFYWVRNPDGELVPAVFAGETLGSDALAAWSMIREMYDEGTIAEDIFITSVTQAEEAFLSGERAAICIDGGIANSRTWEDIASHWRSLHGRDFFEDVGVLGLMPDVNGIPRYTVWDYAWSESYISSRVSDEKLERILALYDWLLSEEGMHMAKFGIEGVTWSKTGDGHIALLGDQPVTAVYPSTELFSYLVCWNYGLLDTEGLPSSLPESYIRMDEARVEEARKCELPDYDYEATRRLMRSDLDFSIDINAIFRQIVQDTAPVEETWAQIIKGYEEAGLKDVIRWVNGGSE